jgi:hypothetical protein
VKSVVIEEMLLQPFRRNRIALCLAFFVLAATLAGADETREPSLSVRLEIGGKALVLSEGEALRLDGTFTDPTVRLTVEPFRKFAYGGVSFSYPRGFTFEAEITDDGSKTWTLSGNDFKILYFAFASDLSTEAYVEALISRFGKETCRRSRAVMTLGGEEIKGLRLEVKLAALDLTIDAFRLPSPDGTTRLLSLQDSPDESGRHSAEARDALAVLQQSWRLLP